MMYPEIMPRWHEMAQTLADNHIDPFASMSDMLQDLGMTTNQANAMFLYDYYDAELIEDDYRRISALFEMVVIDNAKKYETLIESYPFAEMRKRVRAPDITKEAGGSSTTEVDTKRNQSEKVTETPKNDFGQTRTHSVNPYDNPGFTDEYKDTVKNQGYREVETSYTGTPDHTESTVTAGNIQKETGTETTTETITGNAKQTMSEAMQDIGQAATIWQIIEKDIAKKIFLQIWR